MVVNRLHLFFTVNQICIDNDQVVMWAGAKDFSEGKFHVPLFYGQDYNTMLEALVATPLVWLSVPIYHAVPIATHLLFLFPFLFTAFYLFKKQLKSQAIIVLAILLCLPVGYDIITSIPRGFVTGLFFTSFFIISILNPQYFKWLTLNTFLCGIAYMVNPNSVLVSAPFLCFMFLHHYQNKKYYYASIIGVLPALIVFILIKAFYSSFESPLVYKLNNEFNIVYFKEGILNICQRFIHIAFFNEGYSILLFIILGLIACCFWLKNKKAFIAFVVLCAVIVASLFTSKAGDGAEWAFYSYSRLYIGIPLFMYLFLSTVDLKKILIPIICVTLFFTVIKTIRFNDAINYHIQENKWSHSTLIALKDLKNHIALYNRFAKEYNATHFIVGNVWRDDFINYAAEIINPDFPKTFKPSYERRSWLITDNKNTVIERFLILMREPKDIEALNNPRIFKLDDYGLFLVTDNTLTFNDFSNKIHCPIYEGD